MFNIFKTLLSSESSHSPPPLPEALLERLEATKGVALVLDPKSLFLLGANSEGRALFPELATKGTLSLDSAMPALRTLQDVTQSPTPPARLPHLLFWTARGPQKLNCRLERVESGKAPLLLLKEEKEPTQEFSKPSLPSSDLPPEKTSSQHATASFLPIQEHLPEDLRVLVHELRTPLSAIASVSEALKEEKLGPLQKKSSTDYLREIGTSAHYALALLERLGQIPASKNIPHKDLRTLAQTFRFETLSLTPLLTECLSMIQSQEKAHDIRLKFRPPFRSPRVLADATSLKQIVLNLLTNALKFTPAGGQVKIVVATNKNGDVLLSIADTGYGMTTHEILETMKTSDPFSTAQQKGSLGVGLPLSKALAEANGAHFSLASRVGKGTTVTLTFPKRRLLVI